MWSENIEVILHLTILVFKEFKRSISYKFLAEVGLYYKKYPDEPFIYSIRGTNDPSSNVEPSGVRTFYSKYLIHLRWRVEGAFQKICHVLCFVIKNLFSGSSLILKYYKTFRFY